MEYEKCYVFSPDDDRPAKRRRTEPTGLQASWNLRKKTYRQAWSAQQQRIDERLDTINAATIAEIASFLDESAAIEQRTSIPTGLILAGPNSALRHSIASQGSSHNASATRRLVISLTSSSGSNLKALLKSLISKGTSTNSGDDEDDLEEAPSSRKGPKLLNYDLKILHDYAQERKVQQVVIAFEDTEAVDSDLLSELIELLGCWQNRIPFALLLNVATSVEFLQQRLTSSAIKCLDGRLFDAANSTDEVEQVFDVLTGQDSQLWLGPNLASMILERQSDYIQGIDSLTEATRYAYMAHFYANATSLLLTPGIPFRDIPKDHFEAIRNLPSFRTFARQLLDDGETERLRSVLDSDQALFDFTNQSVEDGRQSLAGTVAATEAIRQIQECLPSTPTSSKASLYLQAMSGKLAESTMIRSLLLMLRKSPSDVTLNVTRTFRTAGLDEETLARLGAIETELTALTTEHEDSGKPLRSEEDVKNSTLRTTVVAQKVELSKQKSTLSKQDTAYTALVRRLSDLLEAYFADRLVGAKELVLNEIFVYDLRSPYREVFMPRPRHAIERALAAPHDYLDCECCDPGQEGEEATLAGTQPSTAVLYQLYLESGNLINAHDLWKAFGAVIEEGAEDEQNTMALFQRSLAELRYLGLVKNTRKRVDHIAKVSWRGL
ncbi:putative origin recognition complex, subunit 3, origin recognition complex subunit 3, winged helix [Septoria linicola]|nr:putative origin recognition complex, subunit 3, origin recognition complex subunit 3, winged helix [Septoria linicola]